MIGPSWGLFTGARAEKIPLFGPLRENPDWGAYAALSILVGLALTALGLSRSTIDTATRSQIILLGITLGTALGVAAAGTLPVVYDIHAGIAAAANLGGQVLLATLMMLRTAGALAPAQWRTGADATRRIRQWLRLRHAAWPGLFEDAAFLFAWAAAVDQILLVFDPRYRDFPLPSFAVPLVVVAARAARRDLPVGTGRREEVALAVVLTGGAIASAVQEGALNGQSLQWNACVLVLALPVWVSLVKARK